ncbi:hypothetical protein CDD81_1829 [Ophiocordyceps australis]|uniref:Uncharacterized protein n=1 Tax=Ophiocordyceps australis TaxID=1399860 RepID=A0A2C5Y045_9HYPO|nr:hypothetical protein CDD81_1829 [Ophiocordyceps australis]
MSTLSCPLEGNADLYGLGIRIGIYIQMLTVQLSGLLSAYFQVEDNIGQGTIVFVLSTAIVLVRLINASVNGGNGGDNGRPVEPVEVFPLVTLLLLQVGVCRVSASNKTTLLIWTTEFVGLTALFSWFWWHGMDLLPNSCPRDHDKAFFFAKVGIWGWYRSFNKASSVFAALAASFALVANIGAFIVYAVFSILRFARKQSDDEDSTVAKSDQDAPRNKIAVSIDLIVNIGAIVYVEMALRWNQISGVYSLDSPGQFMPFVIALGQLFSVFFSAAKYLLQSDANESLLDHDQDVLQCYHADAGRWVRNDTEDIALT